LNFFPKNYLFLTDRKPGLKPHVTFKLLNIFGKDFSEEDCVFSQFLEVSDKRCNFIWLQTQKRQQNACQRMSA